MKTIFFLGQAPARPSSKHAVPGTYLHPWLTSIGFNDNFIRQQCHFYALTDIFPGATKGNHLPPTKHQIAAYLPTLRQALLDLQPDIIVPVGKMAIVELFDTKDIQLDKVIGHDFSLNPFESLSHEIVCIPLPHPSGRSAWNHTHKQHIQQALEKLKTVSLLAT